MSNPRSGSHPADPVYIQARKDVYFSRVPSEQEGLGIIRIAHEHWGPVFRPRGHSGPPAVYSVVSGNGGHLAQGQEWPLRSGAVFFHLPGVPHETWSDSRSPLEVMNASFGGREAHALLEACLGELRSVVYPDNPHRVLAVFEQMFRVGDDRAPFAQEICNQYFRILLLTIQSGLVSVSGDGSMAMTSFFRCKEFIDRNFESMLSAQEASDACHVSHAYLCRLFRRYADTSPHAYLLRLKMNLATHLLLASSLTVQQIAHRLGFSNQYAFSKSFKRMIGVAPSVYRGRETSRIDGEKPGSTLFEG